MLTGSLWASCYRAKALGHECAATTTRVRPEARANRRDRGDNVCGTERSALGREHIISATSLGCILPKDL